MSSDDESIVDALKSLNLAQIGRVRGRGIGRGGNREYLATKFVEYKERATEIGNPLIFVGGEDNSSLEDWQGMKPSECWIANEISMVKVFQSKEKEERSKTFFQVQDEAALNEEFEQLKNAHSDSEPTVTAMSLESLALKYKFTTGKWLFFVPWTEVDKVWQLLVHGLLDGKFPDDLGVIYIRIYGRSDAESNPHNIVGGEVKKNATLTVYSDNWTDEEKTMKIAHVIRALGIKEELKYKPDIYTFFEIFRNGIFQIPPTIYQVPESQ